MDKWGKLLIVVCGLALAACGGKDKAGEADGTGGPVDATDVVAADGDAKAAETKDGDAAAFSDATEAEADGGPEVDTPCVPNCEPSFGAGWISCGCDNFCGCPEHRFCQEDEDGGGMYCMWECEEFCKLVECGDWWDAGGAYNDCHCGDDCDDGNPCTQDSCSAPGWFFDFNAEDPALKTWCKHEADDTAACEDGDPLTVNACKDGVCAACTPECVGKECGDDGCGGSCGACDPGCPLPTICDSGVCLATCEPQCDGKECGDDGCGCPCGECDDGKPCTDDSCVDGACQTAPSTDKTPCGESDEPSAEDFQYCLQGVCCHPNVNWCWDGTCDCNGWPMYGTCESECDSVVDDTDWGAMCVWECGGDCCNADADCPADKPRCAGIPFLKYEGMWPTGRCVEQVSYPACWWTYKECQEGELCVGAPTAEDCPYCNVSCPWLKPGLCKPAKVCGNGLVEPDLGEVCDDGNSLNGDGCNHLCQLEVGCAPCVCKNCNAWGCCEMDLIHCDADDEFLCVCMTPGPEECDGVDDNCDGQVDEGFPDTDKDGVADCLDPDDDNDGDQDVTDCAPQDPNIHHQATELCNGLDDDCDGEVDEWCDCIPDCNGKECGDDGCGGSCGTCPEGQACKESGKCE